MPKESKKFINPLLRPSQQEVEPKRETPPKQEKTTSSARVQAARTQLAEPEEKSVQTSPTILDQKASNSDAAPANEDSARTRSVREKTKITAASPDPEPQAALHEPQNDAAQPEQDDKPAREYDLQAETLKAHPDQTVLRPESPSYIAHIAIPPEDTVVEAEEDNEAPQDVEGEISEDTTYEPEIDFSSNPAKARRKKGAQAFEKTHVRFTVWVDKNLKQSFEDIAFQRDKPKTTLLNEALADLVRKYETP